MSPQITFAAAILFLAAIGYTCVWFPLSVAKACFKSTELSPESRMVWTVVIVVLFPLGSWLYALTHGSTRRTKLTAAACLVTVTGLAWWGVHTATSTLHTWRASVDAVQTQVGQDDVIAPREQKAELSADMAQLRDEISGNPFNLDRTAAAVHLTRRLDARLADRRLTAFEFDAWTIEFRARATPQGGSLDRVLLVALVLLGRDEP